jgi:hypothetical protein
MAAKPNIKNPNTREYWELAVRKPAEYGFNTKQAQAMRESLDLTDPKYWKKVLANPKAYLLTTEQAKDLAKFYAKTLAEDIDEQNQMTPEERMDAHAGHHIGYYEVRHGKGHVQMWLEMSVVSPGDAAQLLHGENPTVIKVYDLGDVFGNMKKSFEDVARDGRNRDLRDWIAVARQQNLHAVCIDGWEACATVLTQYQPRKVVHVSSDASGDVAPLKQRNQERRILGLLKQMKFDTLNLPPRDKGKSGLKRKILEEALKEPKLFSKKSFDHAWQRLRNDGSIAGSK